MGRSRTWHLPRATGSRLGEAMVRPTDAELAELRSLAAELRFWEKVAPPDERGCLLWRGSILKANGYGQFNPAGTGSTTTAHRWAWEHWRGQVPDGMHVCHVCDVRACVNVAHLFVGTPAENVADKVRKGRHRPGEQHPMAKLSESDVLEIRMRAGAGEPQSSLASDFGVGENCIYAVVSGLTWRHVTGGTRAEGARVKKKLSDDDVKVVRQMRASGDTLVKIAAHFGVGISQIHRIVNGQGRTEVA